MVASVAEMQQSMATVVASNEELHREHRALLRQVQHSGARPSLLFATPPPRPLSRGAFHNAQLSPPRDEQDDDVVFEELGDTQSESAEGRAAESEEHPPAQPGTVVLSSHVSSSLHDEDDDDDHIENDQ
ncbi:MAG: hypothetical protein Q9212_006358 [Teloschistes hypoglaucus]